jgi:hypothetical protein
MQTNKHTSGPWFRTVSQHNGETVYDICTAADNGEPKEMIARVNHCVITPGLAISDEVRANARLIAAAPDLLAALINCIPLLEASHLDNALVEEQTDFVEGIFEGYEQAKAAIAKAKGAA